MWNVDAGWPTVFGWLRTVEQRMAAHAERNEDLTDEQRKVLASEAKSLGASAGRVRALGRLHFLVERVWFKWLRRRAEQRRHNWAWFGLVLRVFPLPPPRIVHSALRAASP